MNIKTGRYRESVRKAHLRNIISTWIESITDEKHLIQIADMSVKLLYDEIEDEFSSKNEIDILIEDPGG